MALILGMMLLFSSGISTAVMAQDNGSDEIPIVENSTDTVVEEETKKQETSVIEGYREVSDSTEDTSGSTDISENKTKARTSAPLTNEPVAKTAKSLTVASDGGDYATIQSAIDYISQQDDKENWTINVKGGEYERFTVLNGLNHLTIQVVSGERAKIETLNDSQAPASTSGAYPDTGGISVRKANHVTIKGFDITMGNNIDKWFFSAISNHSDDNSKGNDLSVSECIFRGNGSSTGVFIDAGSTEWKVNNCTFENIYEAISMYGDGTLLQDARIDSNKFENCSFALHGYYGGTGNSGVLKFTNNTVYGTDTLRCKVVVQDQINTGAIKVDISNNVLDKGIVGLVNLREDGENISDVLKSNKMNAGSFYVEAIEPGSIDFYTSYQAPENDAGYWILNEKNFDSPDFVNYVKELVKKANSQHSRVLNITIDDKQELIKTFTWFKDALYWKSIDAGNLAISKTVTGTHGDKDKDFHFTVTLEDKTVNGTYGDMDFKDGIADITLKHGEKTTATGLPADIKYTVTETEADQDGYVTSSINETGTIPKNDIASVTFTNAKSISGSLIVNKEVTGTHGDKDKDFHFTITLEDKTVRNLR